MTIRKVYQIMFLPLATILVVWFLGANIEIVGTLGVLTGALFIFLVIWSILSDPT